jgi:prepilin-type N-terminal cleavage/methylation domain-containing protein
MKKTASGKIVSETVARNRHGLTLMELLVVLTILVALASILIPMFPNFLRRAHKATDATQTSEMAKAIQTYQASFLSYPDNFDLLLDSNGTMPAYLPGAQTTPGAFGGFVTAGTLTSNEVGYLQNAGINFVQPLQSATAAQLPLTDPQHPTMNPYPAGTTVNTNATSVANSGLKFALVNIAAAQTANPNFLQVEVANDPTAVFVVFGVGARNSMIGQTIQDAPLSVSQKKDFTPDNTYSRVGVIFKVDGVEVQKSERARFVAAVALEDDELESTEKDTVGYYGVSADPRLNGGS